MNFVAITITDLSNEIKECTYASIKSYLKYNNNKLIVYIIGTKEFLLKDDRIEIIRLDKKDYELSQNTKFCYFKKIINILVEKTLIFSKHENFMFFDNDVFFFDNMQSVWDNLDDGVSGHTSYYNEYINTGLVFVKNYKFNFLLNDVINYFSTNITQYPDEEFLSTILNKQDVHLLNQDVNVLAYKNFFYNKSVLNTKSIHMTGLPKPPKLYLKNINRSFLPLYRKVYEFFH